jgi:uncharacterized protein YqgV (UPF0045/DUF77 family)
MVCPVQVRVEFTIEPFVDGSPGRHVQAALEALATAGIAAEFGPFGSSFEVDHRDLGALSDAISAAVAAGATRISAQVEATT